MSRQISGLLRGDAGEVAEARAAERKEVAPRRLVDDGVEVARRPAGAAGGSPPRTPRRGFRASSSAPGSRSPPRRRSPSGPARARSVASGVRITCGRCTAWRRRAGCRTSLPAIGCAGTKDGCARAARAAPHRPRRAWSSPRPSPACPVDQVADRLEGRLGGGHRHGDEHDVGARDRQQCRLGAPTSMTPSWRARSVVEGDLL